MSIDPSLKTAGNLTKHRNVLTRAERIEKLVAEERFAMDEGNPIGLPKVANRKVVTGGKSTKKEGAEEGAEGAEAASGSEANTAGS